MTCLAIRVPAADGPYADMWRPAFDRYAAALSPQGFSVEPLDWRFAPDTDADVVTPLLAWGYHLRTAEWLAGLKTLAAEGLRMNHVYARIFLAAEGLPMINSAALLRWNTTKTYLNDLEDADVPVVPTIFADRLTPTVIAEARELLGGGELVVKPQVSGGSHETIRLTEGAPLIGGPAGAAMIQPFLPSVAGEGEISLLFFDGVFSHAVGKVAQGGDFRVQPQFGARIGPIRPSDEALDVARSVFAALDQTPAYCRVDLIRHLDGSLRLMELEAIEPDLFLQHAPDAAATFAAAFRRALDEVE